MYHSIAVAKMVVGEQYLYHLSTLELRSFNSRPFLLIRSPIPLLISHTTIVGLVKAFINSGVEAERATATRSTL